MEIALKGNGDWLLNAPVASEHQKLKQNFFAYCNLNTILLYYFYYHLLKKQMEDDYIYFFILFLNSITLFIKVSISDWCARMLKTMLFEINAETIKIVLPKKLLAPLNKSKLERIFYSQGKVWFP